MYFYYADYDFSSVFKIYLLERFHKEGTFIFYKKLGFKRPVVVQFFQFRTVYKPKNGKTHLQKAAKTRFHFVFFTKTAFRN